MKNMIALISGLIFGLGLQLSQMTNPAKVKAFLDVFGDWDPSLAFVMGGALAVSSAVFYIDRRRPVQKQIQITCAVNARRIDRAAAIGAVCFGIGWGWAGLCPGPAMVNLATLDKPFLLFGAGLLGAILTFRLVQAARL